ncbi:MAG TPA: TIM barrel protein [Burkholderiaceae bacterium]|nr:TIM barrel protein [Burkholderiaceae bacterium]
MPRFAANVSLFYPEHPLVDRIGAAARDGFAAVEVQGPYSVEASELQRALRDARTRLVLMNAPVGDSIGGERGLAALPGREAEFDASMERALDYARVVGAPRVHVMAGAPPANVTPREAFATYARNIARACSVLGQHEIDVMIEPINPRDMPGYFLDRLPLALEVIDRLPAPKPQLQFDFYHLQIIGGDITAHFARQRARVGHVQIAGVPERHEPDTGEVNYGFIFRELDRLGYEGWVGCEYRPRRTGPGGTSAGLGWLRRL